PAHSVIYTLSLHDALPIYYAKCVCQVTWHELRLYSPIAKWVASAILSMDRDQMRRLCTLMTPGVANSVFCTSWKSIPLGMPEMRDRKSTRLNSSHSQISYA